MKFTHKIYLLQLIFSFILFGFLTFVYLTYQSQYKKDINKYVNNKVRFEKELILQSIAETKEKLNKQKKLYLEIHKTALLLLKKNPLIKLDKLKESLMQQFHLIDTNIELYLINKDYTIVKTTYPKDLGFNLSMIPDAKEMLDATKKDKQIHIADTLSLDALSLGYKIYSYCFLNSNTFLELGFTNNTLTNPLIKIIQNNPNITLYTIEKNHQFWSYYKLSQKKDLKSKEELFKNRKKFNIGEKSYNDKIIDSHLLHRTYQITHHNIIEVISPLYDTNMFSKIGRENIVMNIKIDISDKLAMLQKIQKIFMISLIIVTLFLIFLFFYIKRNFTNKIDVIVDSINKHTTIDNENLISSKDEFSIIAQHYNKLFKSLNKEIITNKQLLEENKRFIADTVHQIRTPLTNIMMNSEMIERSVGDKKVSNFVDQINASINMLTNSYEDLSYILSHDTIDYTPTKLSISKIVLQRIDFFTTISKVNFKELDEKIETDLFYTINQIEVERLIDNNISNAVKYATVNKPINIHLYKNKDNIFLIFKSFGNPIKNPQNLFEKNYRENDSKRGLGLGLNMVKKICEKYNIDYVVTYEDGQNVFTYIFREKNENNIFHNF